MDKTSNNTLTQFKVPGYIMQENSLPGLAGMMATD
jgi:hypothetical protein